MTSHHRRHRPALRLLAGLVLAVCVTAAGAQTFSPTTAPVVARLGSITVSEQEVRQLLQALPENDRAAAQTDRQAVTGWIQQRIAGQALLREARAKGWAERPDVRARVDAAVREISDRIVGSTYLEALSAPPAAYPSQAEVDAAYERSTAALRVPASYRIAQIFLAAPAADADAVKRAREQAVQLAAQARTGDFAALARERSDDRASAAAGGEVGLLPLARMLPEARAGVAALKVGEVGEPVQSASGFHLIKLLEVQPERAARLDEVRPQLELALRQQRQQQQARDYLAALAPSGSLSIDTAALDAALRKAP